VQSCSRDYISEGRGEASILFVLFCGLSTDMGGRWDLRANTVLSIFRYTNYAYCCPSRNSFMSGECVKIP
jgi:hypothetical protein